MRLDYPELYNKEFSGKTQLFETLNDYFPEYEEIFESEYVKGLYKYTWENYIIIDYFKQLYRIDVETRGNGGWLSYDECQVKSITRCNRVVSQVFQVDFEKI